MSRSGPSPGSDATVASKAASALVSVHGSPLLLGGIGSSNHVIPDPVMAAYIAEQLDPPVDAFAYTIAGTPTPQPHSPYPEPQALALA